MRANRLYFELSAAYSTKCRPDELMRLVVRKVIRRLREDWLIFREQILSGEACLINVIRSYTDAPLLGSAPYSHLGPSLAYSVRSVDEMFAHRRDGRNVVLKIEAMPEMIIARLAGGERQTHTVRPGRVLALQIGDMGRHRRGAEGAALMTGDAGRHCNAPAGCKEAVAAEGKPPAPEVFVPAPPGRLRNPNQLHRPRWRRGRP